MEDIPKLKLEDMKDANEMELRLASHMTEQLLNVVRELNNKPEWEKSIIFNQDDGTLKHLVSKIDIIKYNKRLLDKIIMRKLCENVCLS